MNCVYCDLSPCPVGYGFCHCGCGTATRLVTHKRNPADVVGTYRKFLRGHQHRRYTDTQDKEIARRLRAGITQKDVAAQLGLGIGVVQRAAIRHGLSRAYTAVRLSETDVTGILQMLDAGVTQERIACQFGIAQSRVSQIGIAHGRRRQATHAR